MRIRLLICVWLVLPQARSADNLPPGVPRIVAPDGSMVNVVTSVTGSGEPRPDYLFSTSDLEALPYEYYDIFVEMIGLPVCDLDGMGPNLKPAHSAVLVDWFPSDFSPDYSAGIFVSKWGQMGIYQHRWGEGLCPPIYCDTGALKVFAPRQGWDPPYFVIHTPWGD